MNGTTIGTAVIFGIILIWQFIAEKLDVRTRYIILGMILLTNVLVMMFTELRKFGGMLLVFWGVLTASFLLAEYFPRRRGTRQRTLVRRETISMPEDYLFTVGVVMLGIEIWIR